jgi:thiol-disulfide isomerase/thioredoxin
LGILIFPKSREWVQSQISFPPKVIKESERDTLKDFNWDLINEKGERVNFAEFQDKAIFVNFWATWCPPCRAEMPFIEDFYQEFKEEVVFVLVSNEDMAIIEKFRKEEDYSFPIYQMRSRPPEAFQISNSIPLSFLIDDKGRIATQKTGSARWNSSSFYKKIKSSVITQVHRGQKE